MLKVLACLVIVASLVFLVVAGLFLGNYLPTKQGVLKERDAHDAVLDYARAVTRQEWPRVKKGDVLIQLETNEFQRAFLK